MNTLLSTILGGHQAEFLLQSLLPCSRRVQIGVLDLPLAAIEKESEVDCTEVAP